MRRFLQTVGTLPLLISVGNLDSSTNVPDFSWQLLLQSRKATQILYRRENRSGGFVLKWEKMLLGMSEIKLWSCKETKLQAMTEIMKYYNQGTKLDLTVSLKESVTNWKQQKQNTRKQYSELFWSHCQWWVEWWFHSWFIMYDPCMK